MKEILLTQGKIALVDDEDYELISKYCWWPHKFKTNTYARTESKGPDGRIKYIKMHQLILPATPGLMCDHKNRNGLDNRRENLRLATPAENCRNSRRRNKRSVGYKGVCWSSAGLRRKRWVARIIVENRQIFLGYFRSAVTAAKAYDRAARKYFDEFAKTNF